jgi:fructose-specific phosphotransferase system IIC component
MIHWLACWLACWLAGLLACWLACLLAGWLAGLLAGLLACWLAGWLAGWLADEVDSHNKKVLTFFLAPGKIFPGIFFLGAGSREAPSTEKIPGNFLVEEDT